MRDRLSVSVLAACGGVWLALLLTAGPVDASASDQARGDRAPQAASPGAGLTGATMDSSSPSVVLLPPRFLAPPSPQREAAAELACDRLAERIAAAGAVRVVDRTQLDRILQERGLQADLSRPMLSYDAMIRLEVDATRLAPKSRLSLIDLSTGNVLAEQAFAWPLAETDVEPMLAICRAGLKDAGKPRSGTLRVRVLRREGGAGGERMAPLAARLGDVFDEALRRSQQVVFVRHFEAATSKEESLLLLMGLSRLAQGRQFCPQADATIELRVVEGDGQGKKFSETPVEIGVRLRKGARCEGDWTTTAGLVCEFDAMIPQAWRKLAAALGKIRPETAGSLIDEMALRRKQAEAELLACAQPGAARRNLPAIQTRLRTRRPP